MHLNHSSCMCTIVIDNVVHAVTLVCMCMYVCIVPNASVLWAGGLENAIHLNLKLYVSSNNAFQKIIVYDAKIKVRDFDEDKTHANDDSIISNQVHRSFYHF
jgi:hypothetical protein